MIQTGTEEEVIEYYFPSYWTSEEVLRVEKRSAYDAYKHNLWKIVEKTNRLC